MKASTIVLASLLAVTAAGGAAEASTSAPEASSPTAVPIAMGCGVGRTRDAAGHCRRRFDLFQRYRRFQAFKNRNCVKIQTPDGRLDRCRI